MTSAILRLYQSYVEITDRAARSMSNEYQAHVARIEGEICYQLAREPSGVIVVDGLRFQLFAVTIGQEKRSLSYFRVTNIAMEERRVSDAGYSFARRKTDGPDVIPLAGAPKPSLRRKQAVA